MKHRPVRDLVFTIGLILPLLRPVCFPAPSLFPDTYHRINPPTSDHQVPLWRTLLTLSTGSVIGARFFGRRRKEETEQCDSEINAETAQKTPRPIMDGESFCIFSS